MCYRTLETLDDAVRQETAKHPRWKLRKHRCRHGNRHDHLGREAPTKKMEAQVMKTRETLGRLLGMTSVAFVEQMHNHGIQF